MSMFEKLNKPVDIFLKEEDDDVEALKAQLTEREEKVARQNYRNVMSQMKQVMSITSIELQNMVKCGVMRDILAYNM